MFFGLCPSKYIGGSPNILSGSGLYYPVHFYGGSFYAGAHPSSFSSSGINYFNKTGAAQTTPVNTFLGIASPVQTAVSAQNMTPAPADAYAPQTEAAKVENLQAALDKAKNEQGAIGKFWDSIKGVTGIGMSGKKCQAYVNNYLAGKVSYDDVYAKVNNYAYKQKSVVNLITGLAAGITSALAIKNGKGQGRILAAAGIGAGVKAGLKTFERSTNHTKKDALDAKLIVKDGLSGALNGAVIGATTGIGILLPATAETSGQALKSGAIAGVKGGAIAGAAMSAGDYTIECAFDENEKFKADRLITNTLYGAAAGAATGAAAGGLSAHMNFNKNNPAQKPCKTPNTSNGNGADIKPDTTGSIKHGGGPKAPVSTVKEPKAAGQKTDIKPHQPPKPETPAKGINSSAGNNQTEVHPKTHTATSEGIKPETAGITNTELPAIANTASVPAVAETSASMKPKAPISNGMETITKTNAIQENVSNIIKRQKNPNIPDPDGEAIAKNASGLLKSIKGFRH